MRKAMIYLKDVQAALPIFQSDFSDIDDGTEVLECIISHGGFNVTAGHYALVLTDLSQSTPRVMNTYYTDDLLPYLSEYLEQAKPE